MLMKSRKDYSLIYANSWPEGVHGEILIPYNRNKGLGISFFRPSARPM